MAERRGVTPPEAERKDGSRNGELASSGCEFCFTGDAGTKTFLSLYGKTDIVNLPGISPSFVVLQEAVPLGVRGAHILLVPRGKSDGHDLSLASVTDQKSVQESATATADSLRNIFPDNPVFFFEHGEGLIGNERVECGNCRMDHAHGHFVVLPTGSTFETLQTATENNLGRRGWSDTARRGVVSQGIFVDTADIAGGYPYLLIGMVDSDGGVTSRTYVQRTVTQQVESQLLRKLIATEIHHQPQPDFWHTWDILSHFPERIEALRDDVISFGARVARI